MKTKNVHPCLLFQLINKLKACTIRSEVWIPHETSQKYHGSGSVTALNIAYTRQDAAIFDFKQYTKVARILVSSFFATTV